MVEVTIIALIVAIIILLFSRMKWWITVTNLIYYMEKKGYRLPDEKDLKECTEYVIKNKIKDLIWRR